MVKSSIGFLCLIWVLFMNLGGSIGSSSLIGQKPLNVTSHIAFEDMNLTHLLFELYADSSQYNEEDIEKRIASIHRELRYSDRALLFHRTLQFWNEILRDILAKEPKLHNHKEIKFLVACLFDAFDMELQLEEDRQAHHPFVRFEILYDLKKRLSIERPSVISQSSRHLSKSAVLYFQYAYEPKDVETLLLHPLALLDDKNIFYEQAKYFSPYYEYTKDEEILDEIILTHLTETRYQKPSTSLYVNNHVYFKLDYDESGESIDAEFFCDFRIDHRLVEKFLQKFTTFMFLKDFSSTYVSERVPYSKARHTYLNSLGLSKCVYKYRFTLEDN